MAEHTISIGDRVRVALPPGTWPDRAVASLDGHAGRIVEIKFAGERVAPGGYDHYCVAFDEPWPNSWLPGKDRPPVDRWWFGAFELVFV